MCISGALDSQSFVAKICYPYCSSSEAWQQPTRGKQGRPCKCYKCCSQFPVVQCHVLEYVQPPAAVILAIAALATLLAFSCLREFACPSCASLFSTDLQLRGDDPRMPEMHLDF